MTVEPMHDLFEIETHDDSGQAYPWARQHGETDLGFDYFMRYLRLGPNRSVRAAARQVGRDPSTLRAVSQKFFWPDRAAAYDKHLDKIAIAGLAEGRTRMRSEYVEMAMVAREKIYQRLKNLDPEEMSVRDAATWFDLTNKIERQARGEPDRVIEVKNEITVVEQLDAGARRQLMNDALSVLAERLGMKLPGHGELEGVVEAEIVEETMADGSSPWSPDDEEEDDEI